MIHSEVFASVLVLCSTMWLATGAISVLPLPSWDPLVPAVLAATLTAILLPVGVSLEMATRRNRKAWPNHQTEV